jgi:hypothetical protein
LGATVFLRAIVFFGAVTLALPFFATGEAFLIVLVIGLAILAIDFF